MNQTGFVKPFFACNCISRSQARSQTVARRTPAMHWNRSCPRPKRLPRLKRTGKDLRHRLQKTTKSPRRSPAEQKVEVQPSRPTSPRRPHHLLISEKTTKSPKSPNWTNLHLLLPRKKNHSKSPKRGLQVQDMNLTGPTRKSVKRSPFPHLVGIEVHPEVVKIFVAIIMDLDLLVHPEMVLDQESNPMDLQGLDQEVVRQVLHHLGKDHLSHLSQWVKA